VTKPRFLGQLSRTRVLLASRDQDFRAVATAVLTGRGCLVEATDRSSRVPELIGRTRPNVVVVDASCSPRAVSHVLAVMSVMTRPIGLLVVIDDDVPTHVERLPLLRKSEAPATLAAEVERVCAESFRERSTLAALS
jgi:DNA-binding NtrC family response regulator